MIFFNNSKIDTHPLVQCIQKTEVLSDEYKKCLYRELKIYWIYRLQNILKENINLPSQENEIREIFEKVMPFNQNWVNKLIEEYKSYII